MKELIASQRLYFLAGHTRPISERKKNLRKLHDLLLQNESMLTEAIYKDFKKSAMLTVENELSLPYGEINSAIRNLKRWSRSRWRLINLSNFPARTRINPVPYGWTLVIGPWNYPFIWSNPCGLSSF